MRSRRPCITVTRLDEGWEVHHVGSPTVVRDAALVPLIEQVLSDTTIGPPHDCVIELFAEQEVRDAIVALLEIDRPAPELVGEVRGLGIEIDDLGFLLGSASSGSLRVAGL